MRAMLLRLLGYRVEVRYLVITPYANHIASSGSAAASRDSRLQPYVLAPATLCDGACNPN